jgi:HEPN domain-containing protein
LCQQAVEKLLKAAIEKAGQQPPRGHALSTLRHDALSHRPGVALADVDAIWLTQFYTGARPAR